MHHGFKKKQTSSAFVLLFSWDEECLPGKIKVNLRSKVRDANKSDDNSSKLVPKYLSTCKSPHTAQDAILR